MAGQPGPKMAKAMRLLGSMTPYAAAKQVGVDLATMYKSRLYKLHMAGKHEELERELLVIEQRAQRNSGCKTQIAD
jgi:hypothetical protein